MSDLGMNDQLPRGGRPRDPVSIQLPSRTAGPLILFAYRIGAAIGLILVVAFLAWIERDGYVDANGDEVTFLDALYYSTVSVTTTGYGDIRPASDSARLMTTLLVTPVRIAFLILLIGTTVEVLTERSRHEFRVNRWRRRLNNHVIICGFGTKGRSAALAMMGQGVKKDEIIVVETDRSSISDASAMGLATVVGNAARAAVLKEAHVERARAVVVAPHFDDTAVLVTLTARELNPNAQIVAAVREKENDHLLRQSGANSVITSAEASGRMLGLATSNPHVVEVLEDLLTTGVGLDIHERPVRPDEVGKPPELETYELFLGVVRDGRLHRFTEPACRSLADTDRVLYVAAHGG